MNAFLFVERVAALTPDEEMDGDMSGDAAVSALSALIGQARAIAAVPGTSYPAAWRWRVGDQTPWVVSDQRPPEKAQLQVEPLYALGQAAPAPADPDRLFSLFEVLEILEPGAGAIVTLLNDVREVIAAELAVELASHCALDAASGDPIRATLEAAATWVRRTAATSADAGDRILADTSGGAWTLTLPAAGVVDVQDVAGTWPAEPLTIVGAIRGVDGDLVCDQSAALRLVWDAAADLWVISKSDGVSAA